MPGAESKKKKPPKPPPPEDDPDGGLKNVPEYPPDRYKQVPAAENFARKVLGLKAVSYNGELRIANTVNRALLSMKKRGVKMPHTVSVNAAAFKTDEEKGWLAFYEVNHDYPDEPGRLVINPAHEEWQSDEAMRERRGQFSTGSRYHPVVHEMAELAYHMEVGAERFTPGTDRYEEDERLFSHRIKSKPKELTDAVSQYALKNHGEFVCEVFAALMLGRDELRDNKRVMELYRDLQGPTQFENG